MTPPNPHEALEAAEDAWDAELARQWGCCADDHRDKPEGRGLPGSRLRSAYDAYLRALEAIKPER